MSSLSENLELIQNAAESIIDEIAQIQAAISDTRILPENSVTYRNES